MIEAYVVVALVLCGSIYFYIRRREIVLILLNSRRFLELVHIMSHSRVWRIVADPAVVVSFGPLTLKYFHGRRRIILAFLFVLTMFLIHDIRALPFYAVGGIAGVAVYTIGLSAFVISKGLISGAHPAPGIGLAIPGLSIGPFRIPLVEGIIALAIALIVHEGAHGCIALRRGVRVKRAGFILLGFLPIGAFVDPDESAFLRASVPDKLRILAAGPFMNILVGALFTVALLALYPLASYLNTYACTYGEGARILQVPKVISIDGKSIQSPSYGKLQSGDVILFINGKRVHCADQLLRILAPFRERGEDAVIHLVVQRNGVRKVFALRLNEGYMGVQGVETYMPKRPYWFDLATFLISLISWIAFLNLMIGVVNLLPLVPLDGGQAVATVSQRVAHILTLLCLLLLVVNALPWFL